MILEEILKRLEAEGIYISKRTFELYQQLGFLPKPLEKRKGEKGRGVYGIYEYSLVLDAIRKVLSYKQSGLTLSEIRERLEESIIERYRTALKNWGFSNYTLSEMKGYIFDDDYDKDYERIIARETLKSMNMDTSDEVVEYFAVNYSTIKIFEEKLIKELPLWAPDVLIEVNVLIRISKEAESVLVGLFAALPEVTAENSDKKSTTIILKVLRRLNRKIKEVRKLEYAVNARIAELMKSGEYKGKSKEFWNKHLKLWTEHDDGNGMSLEDALKEVSKLPKVTYVPYEFKGRNGRVTV